MARMGLGLLVIVTSLGLAASLLAEDGVLTNAEVVEMTEAGLGEGLILAKIRQAPKVEFQLEVDDLIALKEAGVGDPVVQAMLERNDPSVFEGSGPATARPPDDGLSTLNSFQNAMGHELIQVALVTAEGEKLLRAQRGEFSTTGMGFMAFVNYPGLHSRNRTTDRNATLLVRSKSQLTGGRYFLAKLDSDQDDGVRSLKISSAGSRFRGMFGNSRKMMEPDPDWVASYHTEEIEPDLWRVTPEKPLEPGEYGWYVDLGAGMQQSLIFAFGVD